MALGALLLGSMRRPDMLSTRVCFCREWVRYTVEGDIDCVDTALADMETMGTKFRKARKWARQRTEATIEHQVDNLGLGSMPNVQAGVPSDQRSCNTGQQVCLKLSTVSEDIERQQDRPALVHQPPPDLYQSGQFYPSHIFAGPQLTDPGSSVAREHPSVPAIPLQRRPQELIPQENRRERNILLDPSPNSQVTQLNLETPVFRSTAGSTSRDTVSSTMINTNLMNSPTSLFSEFTSNPFLDGSSSPSPADDGFLPPDLPFRLFERRCVRDNDGTPSPPKNAVQWPKQTPLVKRPTVDQFKDNLVPIPILARLDKSDRSIGALWKRRAKKSQDSQGVVR